MTDAWRVLWVTLIALTLSNMDQSFFGYAVPGIMADFGFSLSGIGAMISASFALSIVAAFAVGGLVERYGSQRVLTSCLAFSALFVGLQAVVQGKTAFAVCRVVGFAASAALVPVTSAYLATTAPERWRALALAVQQCGYPLGWFVASVMAAPLIAGVGWRASFMIAFAVIPIAWVIYRVLPKHAATGGASALVPAGASSEAASASPSHSSLAELFSPPWRRTALTFGAAFFLYGGAVGGTSFYLPTFFQQTRGYDVSTATYIVGLSYAIGMVGYVGAALVSEYVLSRRKTVVLWMWLGAAFLLATIWLPRTVTEDVIVFGLTTVFFYGSSSITLTCMLESVPAHLRTVIAAVSGTACISLGFVVFPVVTAMSVERFGWLPSFTYVIVPAVVIAGALIASLPAAAPQR